jgi:hypothetical protein
MLLIIEAFVLVTSIVTLRARAQMPVRRAARAARWLVCSWTTPSPRTVTVPSASERSGVTVCIGITCSSHRLSRSARISLPHYTTSGTPISRSLRYNRCDKTGTPVAPCIGRAYVACACRKHGTSCAAGLTPSTLPARKEDAMDSITSFGSWLKQRRRAMGLTQDDLARQAGCAVAGHLSRSRKG